MKVKNTIYLKMLYFKSYSYFKIQKIYIDINFENSNMDHKAKAQIY